jgi:hypothetical protein
MKKSILIAALWLAVLASATANASTIGVLDDYGNEYGNLNTFYTGQGNSVYALADNFTAGQISGSKLLVLTLFNSLGSSQLSALDSYVQGGGRVLLNSDGAGFENYQGSVNAVLSSLGSSIVNVDGAYDGGYHVTSNILANPFTAGVSSVFYAYTSALTGGTGLVLGVSSQDFISYQAIGAGYVFVIADSNTGDGLSQPYGNQQLYLNFLNGGSSTTPEPGTLVMFGSGIIGLAGVLRRKINL